MKNSRKKIFGLIFSLVLVLGFASCGKSAKKNETENQVVDTKSLINNILKTQEEESQKAADSSKKKDDKKEEKKKANKKNDKKQASKDEESPKKKSKDQIKTIRIKAFGDIMSHLGQSTYARNKGGGESFDFSDQFLYMSDFIKDSDIAIGNFETTTNPDRPIAGYPVFNTDVSYPKFLKEAGFDVVTTANNHCLDTGEEGLYATIKAIEDAGLDHVGTQKENEDRVIYKTVNDVKVAFLAYTYGTNDKEYNVVDTDVTKIVNYLDEEMIEKDIKVAKNNNADFIVVYPHWGIEYQSYPSPEQISLGRKMIDWGADLVIGNHPHVVQPGEYYRTEDGRRGFIAYALGNFISLQSYETLGDIRTEQSVAYEITLAKDMNDGETAIEGVKAYPLWVGTTYNEYGGNTQTRLVSDFIGDGKYASEADVYQVDRMKQAQEMVADTVREEVEYRK